MEFLKLGVALAEDGAEVRRRPLGFAAGDGAVVENDDFLPGSLELEGGGQAGDAGADDAHVRDTVSRERLSFRNLRRSHPA